jgi:ubiquinone/menaquinone biosynthesis C-methylase UbiE
MDFESEIHSKTDPRRVPPAGLRYDLLETFAQSFYRDLDPDEDRELDLSVLAHKAIGAETARIIKAVEGLQKVAVIGVNPAWPACRIAKSVGELTVVHPDREQLQLAEEVAANKWKADNVQFQVGSFVELPLDESSADCVISDCGLASWEDPARIATEVFRVLDRGGLVVAREANWGFELQGKPLMEECSFKRYSGDIYFGYTKRTLDPPREVEYVCLMDQEHLWVQNLRSLPRDVLANLKAEDCPGPADLLVSAEYFEIHQMTAATLADLLHRSGFTSVEVSASAFQAAGDEHFSRVSGDLEEKGNAELARLVARSWKDLTAVGSPLLLATAVRPM